MPLEKGMDQNWRRALAIYLEEMSLEGKLKTLEHGKTARCVKCNKIFYDRQNDGERSITECITPDASHECVVHENYIIIWRGFEGIIIAISHPDSMTPEDAIIRYFKKYCSGKD